MLGILLQIMEEGVLTDSTGRRVSFKNTIVVMTSNAGGQLKGEGLGFCAEGRGSELVKAVCQTFTPEFLGRLDETVHFQSLGEDAMEAIAWKYLRQLRKRLSALGMQLQIPEDLAGQLGKECSPKTGARQLRRLIQNRIEAPLASYLLGKDHRPSKIEIRMDGKEVLFY